MFKVNDNVSLDKVQNGCEQIEEIVYWVLLTSQVTSCCLQESDE